MHDKIVEQINYTSVCTETEKGEMILHWYDTDVHITFGQSLYECVWFFVHSDYYGLLKAVLWIRLGVH